MNRITSDNLSFITRIDQTKELNGKEGHCWFVRFKTLKLTKSFADSKYGSKELALAAAIVYRNEQMQLHGLDFPKDKKDGICKSGLKPLSESERRKIQRKLGKQKIFVGTGRYAAEQAREMGASKSVIEKIYYGKQDYFQCAMYFQSYEICGFNPAVEINNEVYDFVKSRVRFFSYSYAKKTSRYDIDEVTQKVIIHWASSFNIDKYNNKLSLLAHICKKHCKRYFLTEKKRRKNLVYYDSRKDSNLQEIIA